MIYLSTIFSKICDTTNTYSPGFNQDIFKLIQKNAYLIAEKDGFSKSREFYWDFAKFRLTADLAIFQDLFHGEKFKLQLIPTDFLLPLYMCLPALKGINIEQTSAEKEDLLKKLSLIT